MTIKQFYAAMLSNPVSITAIRPLLEKSLSEEGLLFCGTHTCLFQLYESLETPRIYGMKYQLRPCLVDVEGFRKKTDPVTKERLKGLAAFNHLRNRDFHSTKEIRVKII